MIGLITEPITKIRQQIPPNLPLKAVTKTRSLEARGGADAAPSAGLPPKVVTTWGFFCWKLNLKYPQPNRRLLNGLVLPPKVGPNDHCERLVK
ncbi:MULTISPECIES: hypothetical protein [unclassified Moorena]|uniref:hypothetical protein n=1 Tax=unclassified Moorena TaxID=2683338 RepID=UPI0013FE6D12|nr:MULTISPECIES: hypothetical protein [unclassified Moorena]NEO11141.1 hypothetical protein [Moorena sp. SIO3E8]NEP98049.1 hypothetical protein [Moorena sp. SIO3F7]